MRLFHGLASLLVLGSSPTAWAQDSSATVAQPEVAPEPDVDPGQLTTSAITEPPPKVVIIVVGDPDPVIRGLARQVDDALEPALQRPFDPGLRGALRGEIGEPDDGLREVRRDRRRLSGDESEDAPILAALGRRAGALVAGVVRPGDQGPELVALDVRHAAFYEGAVPLTAATPPGRIVRFLNRRARAAAHVASLSPEAVAARATPEAAPEQEEEEEDEPDFFEQYWPYLVAAVLLGGMIAVIVATQASEQSSAPVLRFVPGGG